VREEETPPCSLSAVCEKGLVFGLSVMGQASLSKLNCRGSFWHEVASIKWQREVLITRMGPLSVLFRRSTP